MYYVFSLAFGLLVPFLALPLAIKLRDDFVAQLYDARRRGVVDNHNLQTFLSGFLGNGKRKFEFPDSNDALFASIALEILQQINEDGEFHPVGRTDNANDAPGQDNNTKNNNIPLPGVNERQISYSRIYPNEETF